MFAATQVTSLVLLLAAVFAACAVEMVEALTIVLAVGVTRGYRTALWGASAAVVVLAIAVGVGGEPLVRFVPVDVLRIIVGTLLLLMGASWLRKAILRAAGLKAQHDEDRIYADTVGELRRVDKTGLSVAFKGVLLEGFEVVLIVVSLGATQHRLGLAAAAAGAAALVVAVAGLVVARQLSEIPENAMKMVVGVLLVSFGVFWLGEGAGLHWPGSDAFLPLIIAAVAGGVWTAVKALKAGRRTSAPSGQG